MDSFRPPVVASWVLIFRATYIVCHVGEIQLQPSFQLIIVLSELETVKTCLAQIVYIDYCVVVALGDRSTTYSNQISSVWESRSTLDMPTYNSYSTIDVSQSPCNRCSNASVWLPRVSSSHIHIAECSLYSLILIDPGSGADPAFGEGGGVVIIMQL